MFLNSRSDWLKFPDQTSLNYSGRKKFTIQKNQHNFSFSPSLKPRKTLDKEILDQSDESLKQNHSNRTWQRIKLDPLKNKKGLNIMKEKLGDFSKSRNGFLDKNYFLEKLIKNGRSYRVLGC
jgi:hypothetical protein